MTFSDETVMAYVDGELDDATRASLEAAMATDAGLAQRVARQRALGVRLRAAFDPVLTEPLPERLLESARGVAPRAPSAVVALPRRNAPRWSWPQWSAIAASLVVGVLLAQLLTRTPGALVLERDGRLLAAGSLARALDRQLAADQPAGAPVEIGVSFRAQSGAYCRSFVVREPGSLAGLACHAADAWRLEVLASNPAAAPPGGTGYRPAASALPASVAREIEALREGEPLDAAAESAARAHGWRP